MLRKSYHRHLLFPNTFYRPTNNIKKLFTTTTTPPPTTTKMQNNTIIFSSIDVAKNARQLSQPSGFGFSPDDRTLAYIAAASSTSPDTRFLHVLNLDSEKKPFGTISRLEPMIDMDTDDSSLSLEEKLRKERQRIQAVGILSFAWCTTGRKMLVPCQGSWYSVDPDAEKREDCFKLILGGNTSTEHQEHALDACFTPSGEHVVFVRSRNLYMAPTTTTAATNTKSNNGNVPMTTTTTTSFSTPTIKPPTEYRLSEPPSTTTSVTNGLASFLAQEEMDRSHGFWVSPDGKFVAYEYVDERNVPQFIISNDRDPEIYHYPFAGEVNPKVGLRLASIEPILFSTDTTSPPPPTTVVGVKILDIDTNLFDNNEETYLARVDWLPDSSYVLVQVENRRQQRLKLLAFNPTTGERFTLLEEISHNQSWINLHYLLFPFTHNQKKFLLWGSERSGYQHLYLYGIDYTNTNIQATLIRPVTSGNWIVDSIVGIDEIHGICLFMGNLDNPMEKHMYAVDVTPQVTTITASSTSSPQIYPRLTKAGGTHSCVVDHRFKHVVVTRSTISELPHTTLCRLPDLKSIKEYLVQQQQQQQQQMEQFNTSPTTTSSTNTTPNPSVVTTTLNSNTESQFVKRQRIDGNNSSPVNNNMVIPTSSSIVSSNTSPFQLEIVHVFQNPWEVISVPTTTTAEITSTTPAITTTSPLPSLSIQEIISRLRSPSVVEITGSPSGHTFYSHVFLPDSQYYPGPRPTICIVYGGPHVQRVKDDWSSTYDLRAQRFVQAGFVVVKLDNRGSSRRGVDFESAIHYTMGEPELEDQIYGLRVLSSRGIVDMNRVGITGWSYGGYLSAMAILKYPDVFKVAIAGAPVTHWDGYDTHYTERYMGTPQDNPQGYQKSSCMEYSSNLVGDLLLVHGLIDENVHYRMTARLVSSLIRHRKKFDLLCFPDERHSPLRIENRIYLEDRFMDYFRKLL
jgi:dienelactone hydrolase